MQAPTTGCTTEIHAWVNEFKLQDSVTITFVDCHSNLGDVNQNSQVTSMDASLILQSVVGLITLDSVQSCLADVTESNGVTSLDAAFVLMCTVGNCADLPNADMQNSCANHGNCP